MESFDDRYFGTMYPQLGMLASAFADSSVTLKTTPTVRQRTLTADEKAGRSRPRKREAIYVRCLQANAVYFGLPLVRMFNLLRLVAL